LPLDFIANSSETAAIAAPARNTMDGEYSQIRPKLAGITTAAM
jgi:hypothetical protein